MGIYTHCPPAAYASFEITLKYPILKNTVLSASDINNYTEIYNRR